MMPSFLTAHANTVLLGLVCGAGYYVLARVMEVVALGLAARRKIAAILATFVLRIVIAGGAMLAIVTWTEVHAGALAVGALTGYTVVLGGETARHFRRAFAGTAAGVHGREAAHGR